MSSSSLRPRRAVGARACSIAFGPDGQNSNADLIFDNLGNLYGVTWYGGTYGWGTVFRLAPKSDGSWTESGLYQFKGDKRGGPFIGYVPSSTPAGNLYGTTGNAYTSGYGIVFEFITNSNGTWTKRTLHQFTGGKDGTSPDGDLVFDSAGNLYGTTPFGGADGYGVVLQVDAHVNWRMEIPRAPRFQGQSRRLPLCWLGLRWCGHSLWHDHGRSGAGRPAGPRT